MNRVPNADFMAYNQVKRIELFHGLKDNDMSQFLNNEKFENRLYNTAFYVN
jgi:hypothetical protein